MRFPSCTAAPAELSVLSLIEEHHEIAQKDPGACSHCGPLNHFRITGSFLNRQSREKEERQRREGHAGAVARSRRHASSRFVLRARLREAGAEAAVPLPPGSGRKLRGEGPC